MKNDNANSANASAGTSAAGKRIEPAPSPADEAKAVGKTGVSESAYLKRQEQLAQQAISRALADAVALGGEVPKQLMKSHPWLTLAAGAAAGFAAAAVAVPSKEEQALRKLARLERMLNPEPPKAKPNDNGNGHGAGQDGEHAYKSGRSSLTRAILGEVIGALKPAIVSLLTAGVTAATAKPSPEEIRAAANDPAPSEQQPEA